MNSTNANNTNADDRFIARLIAQARGKFGIPAIAVVVMNSSGFQTVQIEGNRIHDDETPVTINDFFHIGSCSKSVLALVAAKLVDEKKLTWETGFFEIFPRLKKAALEEYHLITLEDLLLCEAGIKPYTGSDEKFPQIKSKSKNPQMDFIKFLLQLDPASTPKASGSFPHLYSNASYTLASAMLEKTFGKNYPEMIGAIFDDLGWETHIGWPNDIDGDQPWGHMVSPKQTMKFPPGHEYKLPELIAPAGDISMKPLDFAAYILMYLQGLRGEKTYLSAQNCQTIHFAYPGFALGVGNSKMDEMKFSVINGSAGTFFTQAVIFPDQDFAFTIMMNAGSGAAQMPAVEWMTAKILKHKFNWWYKFWL